MDRLLRAVIIEASHIIDAMFDEELELILESSDVEDVSDGLEDDSNGSRDE